MKIDIDLSNIAALLLVGENAKRGRHGNNATLYDSVATDGWRQVLDAVEARAVVLAPPFGAAPIVDGGDDALWQWISTPTTDGCSRCALWLPTTMADKAGQSRVPLLGALATVGVTLVGPSKGRPSIDSALSSIPHGLWLNALADIAATQMFRLAPKDGPTTVELCDGVELANVRLHVRPSVTPSCGFLFEASIGHGRLFALVARPLDDADRRGSAIEAVRSLCAWTDGTWGSRVEQAREAWGRAFDALFEDDAERCNCCSPRLLRPTRKPPRDWDLEQPETSRATPTHYRLRIPGRVASQPVFLEHLLGATFEILRTSNVPLRDIDDRLKKMGVRFRERERSGRNRESRLKTTVRRICAKLQAAHVCPKWVAETFVEDADGCMIVQ